jgi:hypothetical protein
MRHPSSFTFHVSGSEVTWSRGSSFDGQISLGQISVCQCVFKIPSLWYLGARSFEFSQHIIHYQAVHLPPPSS